MNALLMLVVLTGMACAQTVSSAFSTNGHMSPAPEAQPASVGTTSALSNGAAMPDLLPQPQGKATLMGGTIVKVDRVRDQLTLNLFGGGRARILFDARTRIYRDGATAALGDLQNGARVYVDTVLAGVDVFAQNIRLRSDVASGQSSGQVVSYDAGAGFLVVNDAISPRQLRLRVSATTVISREGKTASANDLRGGTLVSVTFVPSPSGPPAAHTISILAAPGNTFVFLGRVIHLDLHLGLLVVANPHDQKSYEITFDPRTVGVTDSLREGTTVEVVARFDGSHYLASTIKVDSNPN
jgi:hypothetical protein